MKLLLLATAVVLTFAVGASSLACGTKTSCTLVYIPAVNVTVTDAATGKHVCDATVTATAIGQATETLTAQPSFAPDAAPGDCGYYGGNHGGTLTVTIAKAGYKTTTVSDVHVPEGECGVTKSAHVDASLAP